MLEKTGQRVAPAGVVITETVKDVYAGLPVPPVPRLVLADARVG